MPCAPPVYIEHSELGDIAGRNVQHELINVLEKLVPKQVDCLQMANGVWSIWLLTEKSRAHLMKNVSITIYNRTIEIHDTYPTHKPAPNETIIFKDIPYDASDEEILKFLKQQPGIVMKSGVIKGRIRDKENRLTRFFSGDRLVYVKGRFTPALHTTAILGTHKCRIWHKSQAEACQRCRHTGHSTHNTDKCDAYIDDDDVTVIRSSKFPLCNYYPCAMRIYNHDFISSESAYQWRFLTYIGLHDLAEEVLSAPSAAEAKAIASRVPRMLHKDWHAIKTVVMREVLHAKADCCNTFKQSLLNSAGKRLVEAVRGDIFWSSGLSPLLASSTNPAFFPGRNYLGYILESVRQDLMKEAVLYDELTPLDIADISGIQAQGSPPSHTEPHLPPTVPTTTTDSSSNDYDTDTDTDLVLPSAVNRDLPSPLHSDDVTSVQLEDVSTSPPPSDVPIVYPVESHRSTPTPSIQSTEHSDATDRDLTNEPTEPHSIRNNPVSETPVDNSNVKNVQKKRTPMKQTKITSVFKRKLTPGKEADTPRENVKVSRSDGNKT